MKMNINIKKCEKKVDDSKKQRHAHTYTICKQKD